MKTTEWGSLGFSMLGTLEYEVMQYDAKTLLEAARRLQSGEPLGPMAWSVGECLKHLAETPAALKILNAWSESAPSELRGLNAAVHYVAANELLGPRKSKLAIAAVATAWKVKESTISKYRELYLDDAKKHVDRIVELCLSRGSAEFTDRRQIILVLNEQMNKRAKFDWATPRAAKRTNRTR